ncbi:hypothetical protein CLOHYLEM_06081 [[Clostridium] hylemonae DSM 15053]|uniref:Uncharacterized protein n=1 Tax=[Clostridium] hylemonae DSM 15053 TaxID=553973 RepID=C0C1R1_9FIRM|nr:hypothetical protein CLOHYLEM_06081 [[Clostridium] hylemonae DSM 15053]
MWCTAQERRREAADRSVRLQSVSKKDVVLTDTDRCAGKSG